jgi:bifunctional pyridoxal-dependent enzyme with beta-cystathionase and maltose regulon repressor activities
MFQYKVQADETRNCGPFVWIDLSSFMTEKTVEAERILAWKMIECGVWLSTGESYCSEEPGRFRLTFATSEDSMIFGMARCVTSSVPTGP